MGPEHRVVARTGGRFEDFSPYVPAISDDGTVLFQARLRDGNTVIAEVDSKSHLQLHRASVRLVSHPVAWRGGVLAYGEDGRAWCGSGKLHPLEGLDAVGPLGPTASGGVVAARCTWNGCDAVARIGDEIDLQTFPGEAVTGLPIVDDTGAVWARLERDRRWRVVRNGQTELEGERWTGRFLTYHPSGAALPVKTERGFGMLELPSGRCTELPIPFRGAVWTGRWVWFALEPKPQISTVKHLLCSPAGDFALNSASARGTVVAARITRNQAQTVETWHWPHPQDG